MQTIHLITMASKQVWPQILLTLHLAPERLTILHSADKQESQTPAKRLKKFFTNTGIIQAGGINLIEIPHDDYQGIMSALDKLAADARSSAINLTGGNKLMSLAAMKWAESHQIPAVYLERGNKVIQLTQVDGQTKTIECPLNAHISDAVSPLDLVRCQLVDSEIFSEGEQITLNKEGNAMPAEKFWNIIQSRSPLDFITLSGKVRRNQANEGDRLEYLTALVLLKLGVKSVIRSMELKEKDQNTPHAEIDILFNYGGRLWIGDCKDRNSRDWMFNSIKQQYGSESDIGNRIVGELKISGMKEMKDDLMSANITGGLQAQIICVRKTPFSETEQQYAKANRIAVATKKTLYDDIRRILNPGAPAAASDLESLKNLFD